MDPIALAYPLDRRSTPWRIHSELLLELVVADGSWIVVHLVRP